MKHYKLRIPSTTLLATCLMASLLLNLSCSKEKALEPSKLDNNYFVINDNPDDPIDHAIYEFYKSTGVASFYKDSIYRKQIGPDNQGPARYTYIKLSLSYTPLGNQNMYIYHKPLSSRKNIPALLQLMQNEIISQLPSNFIIPSILLVDSFTTSHFPLHNMQLAYGWTSIHGFNTIGVVVKDAAVMNDEDKKMYAASMLAGIALQRINELYADQLHKDFFSISRAATKGLIPVDIYINLPFMYLLPPNKVPTPQSIGFLFHPTFEFSGIPMETMPREADDIRAFLTAAFYYTHEEFADLHPNEPLLLQKFNIISNLAKGAGFQLAD